MKKSQSRIHKEIKQLKLALDNERARALAWEEQGQYGTLYHDRIKDYSKRLAVLEANQESGQRDKPLTEDENGESK